MSDKWRDTTIGDVADIVGGSTPPTIDSTNFGSDIPWLTPKDLSRPHDRYVERGERSLSKKGFASCSAKMLPVGTVLLTSRAPIGYVAIAKNPISTNQGFRNLVPKQGIVSEFIYYWLRGNKSELERYASGSTFKELSGRALKEIPILIPPEQEQRAIAHILGTLDNKIELNRRMNETLEAIARAIFKSWFIDFDPVRAKAEGKKPFGMDEETAALFPSEFEDSEMGEIPKGWKIGPFTDTINILSGGTPKTSIAEYWGGNIPWYSVVDAPREGDVFTITTEKTITQAGVDNSATKVLPELTTIISARGTVGKLALTGTLMAMNQSCYGLVPVGEFGHYFTYFNTKQLVEMLRQNCHGSVFDTITRQTFSSIEVVVPPEPIIKKYEQIASPLLDLIRNNLYTSSTLAGIRDVLLPKLLSGEIRVPMEAD